VVAEQEAFKIMDYALDVGINFFDTSNVYGPLDHRGMSEEIIGKWFKSGGNRREKTVLGTKVGRIYELDQVDGPNNRIGYSIYKIRRHLEASLRRLQTDHIELYQMHQRDSETGWDEIWEAFESAVRTGKVDYIGSSQHYAWQIMKGQTVAKQRGFMGLVNEQHLYTPFNRLAEHELLPMAIDQGIGITIYSPLFRGVLGMDALNPGKRKSQNAEKKFNFEYLHDTVLEYSKLCHEIGETPANVTLAWELRQPAVTSVIIAPNSIDDLKELLHGVEITLDESTLKRMDEIFPPLMEQNPYPDMPNPTTLN
jgi:aryl-alcohol dehydrogenase-like predicted oxidoreductase